jgi:hypothetical protein
MAVFAQSDFFALFPDIFDADTEYMPLRKACQARCPPGVGEQSCTSALFPGNFSTETQYMPLGKACDAPMPPAVGEQSGTPALFPGNFSAETQYMPLGKARDAPMPPAVGEQSGTPALFPGNFSSHTESENLSDNNDLCFLCLDSKLQRWERLAFDDSAHAQGLGSSVVAFERIAGGEGKSWKHDLRRLQSYSSTLMRDRMLRFACRHDLHTHLVSPRTVTGYVEAWLAYTNVSVLVHEVHARQQRMHPATHGLLCEMAHDMYRQAMLAAATGQRKRAVWFYDTNTRKKRKF